MTTRDRTQWVADWRVQLALVLRCVLYWLLCLIAIGIMLFLWEVLRDPSQPAPVQLSRVLNDFTPALAAVLLLLPLVVADVLRLSHRFTGPLGRLRGQVRAIARGEEVSALHFRENDYWHEVAEEFNAMLLAIDPQKYGKHAMPAEPQDFTRPSVKADIEH